MLCYTTGRRKADKRACKFSTCPPSVGGTRPRTKWVSQPCPVPPVSSRRAGLSLSWRHQLKRAYILARVRVRTVITLAGPSPSPRAGLLDCMTVVHQAVHDEVRHANGILRLRVRAHLARPQKDLP